MELRALIRKLSTRFPFTLSEAWDFPGYQIGKKEPNKEIHKAFLCLDFEETCFKKALEYQPDLILTHHPFLFGKKSEVLKKDPLKEDLCILIENELDAPIYSYHTCFDKGIGGINDQVIQKLGLDVERIHQDSLMRFAVLKKTCSIEELASEIKEKLRLPYVFYESGAIKEIRRIALVAGGASSMFHQAIDCGADCYISGDCPHHTRLDIRRYQINYIDISHEVEEDAFLNGMREFLLSIDNGLDILPFHFEHDFQEV